MKEILKASGGLFGRLIVIGIMCFFVLISMSVICTALFTENIGYIAYGYKEGDSEKTELYKYYNSEGEDNKKEQYEKQGYTIETTKFRSEMTNGGNRTYKIITQLFCTLILIAFVYPKLWDMGTKDSNLVRFKHKSEDIYKGLKIGVLASVPSFLVYLILIIGKSNFLNGISSNIYGFLNGYNYIFIQAITGSGTKIGNLSVIQFILLILPLLIVPVVAFVAYLLGYKDISLSEKIIYKKKK